MPYTANRITRVEDYTQAPDPGRDCHWWRVDMAASRPGWVYVAGSVPPPSEEWIAEELGRQEARLGKALEGRMLGGGLHLENAPRPA